MKIQEGSLLTGSSLQPSSQPSSVASLPDTQLSVHSAHAARTSSRGPAGYVDEDLALEALIGRQRGDMQAWMEEQHTKQTRLVDSGMQSFSKEIKILKSDLLDQSEQMKALLFQLQKRSDQLLEAMGSPGSLVTNGTESGAGRKGHERGQPIRFASAVDTKSSSPRVAGDSDPTPDEVPDTYVLPVNIESQAQVQCNANKRLKVATDHNEYGLNSGYFSGAEVTHSGTFGQLTADMTNLHFAGDLLHAFSNQGVDELRKAMAKYELPQYYKREAHTGAGSIFPGEPERTSTLAKVLRSMGFEYGVCLVILFNTIFITYSTDYAVDHPDNQTTDWMIVVETIFQVYYILELLAKLSVHRHYFFLNKDYLWNILDFALVIAAGYDLAMTHGGSSIDENISASAKNGFSLVFLRLLRVVRLMKVMRLFKVVRFFSELNVLLTVVSSSLRPLFWCTFMLLVFMFMFAVVFTHATAAYLPWEGATETTSASLIYYFGSVRISMLSLTKAATGGEDWGHVGEGLIASGGTYYALYLFFVGFYYLALVNILTGLFVDRTFKAVAADHDSLALEKLQVDWDVVNDLCRIYCAMTGSKLDAQKLVTVDDFVQFMSSPVMRARLAVLDLEVWDSHQFFQMLMSISQSDELDLQSWVTGCMQLRGAAKRLSVQALHAELQRLKRMVGNNKSFGTGPLTSANVSR